MKALRIHAGAKALAHLRRHGPQPQDVCTIPAAAGGPKGLVLGPLVRFLFGTWLPHRADDDAPFADRHNARSPAMSDTLSLLTCYHFGGYHHEHHLYPGVPWWRLPATRARAEDAP